MRNQDLKWIATNKFVFKGSYKSDMCVTTIGFEHSYSLIYMVPFVTQKS